MYKEMKLMDLAKLVYELPIGKVIDFANCDAEEVERIGGWCGIKCVDPFDNDNPQYLIGHYGGECNTRFYNISEYDDRIGDFCSARLDRWDSKKCCYIYRKESDWIECIAKMIADFILDYEGFISETMVVDDMGA